MKIDLKAEASLDSFCYTRITHNKYSIRNIFSFISSEFFAIRPPKTSMQIKNIFKVLTNSRSFRTPYNRYNFDICIQEKCLLIYFEFSRAKFCVSEIHLIIFVLFICVNVSYSNIVVLNNVNNSSSTESIASKFKI